MQIAELFRFRIGVLLIFIVGSLTVIGRIAIRHRKRVCAFKALQWPDTLLPAEFTRWSENYLRQEGWRVWLLGLEGTFGFSAQKAELRIDVVAQLRAPSATSTLLSLMRRVASPAILVFDRLSEQDVVTLSDRGIYPIHYRGLPFLTEIAKQPVRRLPKSFLFAVGSGVPPPVVPTPQTVFENEHVCLMILSGSGTLILTIFSSLSCTPKGCSFWGDTLALKLGLPALGIVRKSDAEIPASLLRDALETLRKQSDASCQTLAYGVYRGGFDAIRYSNDVRADFVVTVSPELPPHDMTLQDLSPAAKERKCYVIYDPFERNDQKNVKKLQTYCTDIYLVPAWLTGRDIFRVVFGTNKFKAIAAAVQAVDADALQRTVTRNRRSNYRLRLFPALRNLATRNPNWARNLLEKNKNRLNATEFIDVNNRIAREFADRGNLTVAWELVAENLHLRADHEVTLQVAVNLARREHRPEVAALHSARLVGISSTNWWYNECYILSLAQSRRLEEASAALARAKAVGFAGEVCERLEALIKNDLAAKDKIESESSGT